jgi:hypothetical protein
MVYFGQFVENYRSSPPSFATFFPSTVGALIDTKSSFGYILGDFFKNSSGNPAPEADLIGFLLIAAVDPVARPDVHKSRVGVVAADD